MKLVYGRNCVFKFGLRKKLCFQVWFSGEIKLYLWKIYEVSREKMKFV